MLTTTVRWSCRAHLTSQTLTECAWMCVCRLVTSWLLMPRRVRVPKLSVRLMLTSLAWWMGLSTIFRCVESLMFWALPIWPIFFATHLLRQIISWMNSWNSRISKMKRRRWLYVHLWAVSIWISLWVSATVPISFVHWIVISPTMSILWVEAICVCNITRWIICVWRVVIRSTTAKWNIHCR